MKETVQQTIPVFVPRGASNIRVEINEMKGKVDIIFVERPQKSNIAQKKPGVIEEYFRLAKLSTLCLNDEYLKHEPETENQMEFKERLIEAMESGLSDILVPRIDPSYDDAGNISFKASKMRMPIVGHSGEWWKRKAEEFMPEKGSRLGTTNERIAFLGLLIRETLIERLGYTVGDAWKAVCDQSKDLGHYFDSRKERYSYEPTGSRQVGVWYDLGNVFKFTSNGENAGFSLMGGTYCHHGFQCPLSNVSCDYSYEYDDATGWIVFPVLYGTRKTA